MTVILRVLQIKQNVAWLERFTFGKQNGVSSIPSQITGSKEWCSFEYRRPKLRQYNIRNPSNITSQNRRKSICQSIFFEFQNYIFFIFVNAR